MTYEGRGPQGWYCAAALRIDASALRRVAQAIDMAANEIELLARGERRD